MWPVSDQFDDAIHDTHQVVILAELWTSGLTALLDGNLAVVSGTVTVDNTAQYRRTASIQIADDEGLFPLVGAAGLSGLEPYGSEVRLYRGIQYADGTQELVPLGVFPIQQTEVVENDQGRSVTLTLTDRSRLVSDARFTSTYYINSGTSFLTAAAALVDYCLPYNVPVDKDIEATSPTTTSGVTVYHEQDDPWQSVQDLCAAVGCEVFFGPDGRLKIRDVVDPTVAPLAFTYADDELSILLNVDRVLTRGPNAVLLTSSAPNVAPIRSLQYDNDPTSPSYWWGSYGQFPLFWATPLVTSQSQADAAATSRLRKILGLAETVTLGTIPHPGHEAGDIIHATRLADGLDTDLIVQQATIPLDAVTAAQLVCPTRIIPS